MQLAFDVILVVFMTSTDLKASHMVNCDHIIPFSPSLYLSRFFLFPYFPFSTPPPPPPSPYLSTLPPYRAWAFAVTAINNQLVLVSGGEHGGMHKAPVLGVWDADNTQWTYPYPKMHTARSWCSAVVHNEWLVVAGGWSASHVKLYLLKL